MKRTEEGLLPNKKHKPPSIDLGQLFEASDILGLILQFITNPTFYQLSCVSKNFNLLVWSSLPSLRIDSPINEKLIGKRFTNPSKQPLQSLILLHPSDTFLEQFPPIATSSLISLKMGPSPASHFTWESVSTILLSTSLTLLDIPNLQPSPKEFFTKISTMTRLRNLAIHLHPSQLTEFQLLKSLISLTSLDITDMTSKSKEKIPWNILSPLTSLQELRLHVDYLDSLESLALSLPNLTSLSLTGENRMIRFKCSHLSLLNLQKLTVSGHCLEDFSFCQTLTHLEVNNHPESRSISRLTNLTVLKLKRVNGYFIKILSPLTNLTDLHLQQLSNIDTDWLFFSTLKKLKKIAISDCGLTEKSICQFQSMRFLEDLRLTGNRFFQEGKISTLRVAQVEFIPDSLKRLNINFSAHQKDGFGLFAKLTRLEELKISGNEKEDDYGFLKQLTRLKKLKFKIYLLTDKLVDILLECTSLRELEFSTRYGSESNHQLRLSSLDLLKPFVWDSGKE